MFRSPATVAFLCLAPLSAAAQNEEALKNAFVGRQVALRVAIPASHRGVDLRFDRDAPFDLKENGDRIREHDAALMAGDVIPVTYIKVKGDMIEFHLGGGGFNWFSDSTSKSVRSSSKTVRETDLEKEIRAETDRDRKRRLEQELDDLRRDRERRDERERREVEELNRDARERDIARALGSGSRFNLRFKKSVPKEALTPEGLEGYLDPYVDFSGRSTRASNSSAPESASSSSRTVSKSREGRGARDWVKGALRADIEDAFGRARRDRSCSLNDTTDLDCRISTFDDGSEEVEATFVEGVLVRFTMRRR